MLLIDVREPHEYEAERIPGALLFPLSTFDSGRLPPDGARVRTRDVLGGRLNEALATPESAATHEVALLATRAMEHHLERRLRTVAMFERH